MIQIQCRHSSYLRPKFKSEAFFSSNLECQQSVASLQKTRVFRHHRHWSQMLVFWNNKQKKYTTPTTTTKATNYKVQGFQPHNFFLNKITKELHFHAVARIRMQFTTNQPITCSPSLHWPTSTVSHLNGESNNLWFSQCHSHQLNPCSRQRLWCYLWLSPSLL